MAKISVIIPVYNVEKHLRKCLESVINQTFKDIEIICVNDGSTDNSLEILEKYARLDERIKVFSQQNSGPALARNFALKQAKGKYIMFCDADDWYEQNMIMEMVKAIETKNVDVVMCDCNIVDISKENAKLKKSRDYHNLLLKGFKKITYKNIKDINVVLWNKIFKRDFILKYNIEYPKKYEFDDLIFVYKYLANVKTFYGLDKKLYNYVVGNCNSVMGKVFAQTNVNSKYDFIFAWQQLYDYFKDNSYNEYLIKYFIEDNFKKWNFYYSILAEADREQAFYYTQEFINKNECLLSNKEFKQITLINNFVEFHKKFHLFYTKLKWYQRVFSIKNSYDKKHKIIYILGFKFSIGRKNNV